MKSNRMDSQIETANNSFKQSSRNRFLFAVGITAACLTVLIIFGPTAEQINKKFEYPGAQREMQLIDAISVVDGTDKVHQIPKSLQVPPPPAQLEIEEEIIHEEGTREIPRPQQKQAFENPIVQDIVDDTSKEFTRELVSMATPMPSSRNYYVINMVLPEYPLEATETERNTPVIFVSVEFFLDKNGKVVESLIKDTNGGPAFTSEVLEKMAQWVIGYYIDPGPGIWLQTTWNFKSPYFTHLPAERG